MKTKLEELIQILEKEASLYEELRRLSQEEEEVVIEGNLKKLDNIVRQQEGLLLYLRNYEKARHRLVESLRQILSLPEKVTISELAKAIDEPYGSQLENLQKTITGRLSKISKSNKNNVSLLEYSVKIIDEYFRFLAGVEKLPIYTSRGWTKKKTQKRKLVDQRT